MTDRDEVLEAEIDRQREAIGAVLATLPNADPCAMPFAALLAFHDAVMPLLHAGVGDEARRRFRAAAEAVIGRTLPEMLRPPAPASGPPRAAAADASEGQRWRELGELGAEMLGLAQSRDTTAAVRAFAALAAAAHLAANVAPERRLDLAEAFAAAADHVGQLADAPGPGPVMH